MTAPSLKWAYEQALAENERLRERGDGFAHQRDGWMTAAKGYRAENERLRDALRRILFDPTNAWTIARDTLASTERTTGGTDG